MKKSTSKKKRRGKISMSEQQILARKIIKDIVEHAIKIGNFNLGHKRFQNIFENRLIKKEENFVTQDSKFSGKIFPSNNDNHKWTFISRTLGKIITIEDNGEIKLYDFNLQSNKIYKITNEDNNKIISAELYEHDQTADTRLLVLFQDFSFFTIDLFILNSELNEVNETESLMKLASSQTFNFRPYLNLPDCNSYIPDNNYIKKIIIFPKSVSDNCKDIILNFSQIAGKFLVFNFLSNSVIGNYPTNHYDYEESNDNNNLQIIYNFINMFMNKSWTLNQYKFASYIIEKICSNNSEVECEFKKLAKVLSMNSDNLEEDNILEEIKDNSQYLLSGQEEQNIYDSIISPVIQFKLGIISINTILNRLKIFLDKVYSCFIAFSNNNFSVIKGRFRVYQLLFLKCFSRNIKLKELFLFHDKENKGYVDEQIAHEIIENLPIGLDQSELNEIFSNFKIIDENKKYMYNYLFCLDEYLISKLIFFSPLNQNKNLFTCKCEYYSGKDDMSIYDNEVSNFLINSIFCKRELTQIIYLTNTNLVFTITPYNKKIYIFKRDTKLTNNPEDLVKIGSINLGSFYEHSPMLLECIEDRNLLISQRTTKYSTELVLINIYDDLIFPFRDKKLIDFNIQNNPKNSSKDLLGFEKGKYILFQDFLYLKRNEIFALSTKNNIFLINPKSPVFNISLKMYENKKTVYTETCKNYCENPNEEIGQLSLTIFEKINMPFPIKNILAFSIGNELLGNDHCSNYSSTDWIILVFKTNEIYSHAINQVYISVSAKEIDIPLPYEDKEQILTFALKNMQKSFIKYYNNDLKNFSSYYYMIKQKKTDLFNEISFIIKESLIYQKKFLISPKDYQFHTIYQLIKLLKDLKLYYNTYQLFEMFPQINFLEPKYDPKSEFLEHELFPENKIDDNEIIDEANLPKIKNQLKSDLTNLEAQLTIFESGLKKFAMYILKQKRNAKKIFELIDEEKEEILDSKQFISGSEKIGLLSQNYLTLDEIKELFKRMDTNHTDVITMDEFSNFFKKYDIQSILSTIKHETSLRIKTKNNILFDIENFILSPKEKKINYISPLILETKNFYFNFKDINFEEIKSNLDIITDNISKEEILQKFNLGYIFLEELKNFINENEIEMEEDDINRVFAYFDQKNKNYFIYVRDIIKYFKSESEEEDDINIEVSPEEQQKLNEKQFLLIYIGVMKKLIKFCLEELELSLNDFSDKFLFIKKQQKSLVTVNNIQTKLIIEKISSRISNFLPIEKKILFNYYLDYYNYGVVFKENLKIMFDYIMKYIYDMQYFKVSEFDTFDLDNANKFISNEKKNINKNKEKLENKYVKDLLPIFDLSLLQFIYNSQHKNNMKNLNLLYSYLCSVGEEKDFMSQTEFNKVLKYFIPINIYNSKFANCLFDYLSETVMLINEQKRRVISVPKIILFIINILKKKEILSQVINIQEIYYGEQNKIIENFDKSIARIKQYNDIGEQINNYSSEYLSLIKEAIFSGLIILNKKKVINTIKNQLIANGNRIVYASHFYYLLGNSLLVQKFNKRLKAINKLNKELKKIGYEDPDYNLDNLEKDIDYAKIEIPSILIDFSDPKQFINVKKYLCGMIESFDYYHPGLRCYVNVIKIRKTFLFEEISDIDGQNLLRHIEFSLKVNHYLQQEYLNKSATIKTFDEFPFLRNFGVCSKEVIINKRTEEEYYIINEKINSGTYISLYSLIKSNGGLLQIPELINTDMAFYILRYWGKNILNILSNLFNIKICLKYFTTKDFYVSYDGKKLKMGNLLTYSFCDMKGRIYSGPDLLKILVLLDNIEFTQLDQYRDEQIDEIFSDAYIPPEFIKSNTKLNSRIDSWVFGIILFNILFGHSPISYFIQQKNWYEFVYQEHYNKEKYDNLFLNKEYPFYFNPFLNISEIMEDKNYFLKALKLKSFSAIVKKTHLNLATENNDSINGIGIILDMINSCLSIDPKKRPLLSSLIQCDLFNFEPQELILCNKFLINVLNYYSPDNIINEKMLIPLRGICCEIIRNEQSNPNEINDYQNFIFNVIRELNTYLFSRTFSAKARHSESNSNDNDTKSSEKVKDDIYIKTPQSYYKNSIIAKYIVETKVVDILIFLVLRHFDINLLNFKKKFKKELKQEMDENLNNLGKIRTGNLTTEKKSNYYNEMKHYCGRLISALIDFLYNCLQAMTSYDHALTLYVENILLWIIKLFIGEENQLLGDICDNRDSDDTLKKYIIYRTFMRDENLLFKNNFKEDELDQVFSILNTNKDLCEIKSYWCPELSYFTIDLFMEAFGEKCLGNNKYIVIKNYFLTINSYTKNIANQLENPLVNNKINDYISFIGRDQPIKIKYSFINSDYVSMILSLCDMATKLMYKSLDEYSHFKHLEDKRNALSFIHTILKNKNSYKVRACLDFKIHFIIQKFLFNNQNNLSIRKEIFNILKEISLCLLDMNEINWMFGNNFDKVFGEIYKEKTDLIDLCETYGYGNNSNWDSNFSLIDFMNKLLTLPYTFVLYFTSKFLSINLKKSADSYITYMKEFGNMFASPLFLTPLIKAIKNPSENYFTKQLALDIIFNLMLSNDKKIISNFNLTLCNFYELLVTTVRGCIQLPKHLQPQIDDVKSVEVNADRQFKESVKNAIKIIIELQNPYIKTQIFSCPTMLKYMKQNNLVFKSRMDINEIENKFNEINKTYLNKDAKSSSKYDKIDSKIIFWINCFKCWIFHIGKENIYNYIDKIKNVMYVIYKLLNNEWNQGIQNGIKNCLVFNIMKLYEWIIKNYYHEFIFPKDDESLSLQVLISFLNKIRDNNLTMKDLIIKINKMSVAKTDKNYFTKSRTSRSQEISKEKEDPYYHDLFGNKSYILQKMYNYMTIKMFNIVFIIFEQNDPFYNQLFEKIKFGVILSELFKIQYDTISLFLNQEYIDTSILDDYMAEVKLRLGLFECLMKLSKKYDNIKLQFIENDFINYMFKNMIFDFRKFNTDFKKLTLEFLAFKTSFVLRAEALSFINIIFKKNNNINGRTKIDCFIFDEIIRNLRVFEFVKNELNLIKKKGKGNEVLSSMAFFNMILSNNERDIIKIMNLENASDYFVYAIQKDSSIKKLYPFVPEYISKVKKGIEKEK